MGMGSVAVTAMANFLGLQTVFHPAPWDGYQREGLLSVAGPRGMLPDQPLHQQVKAEVPAGVAPLGREFGPVPLSPGYALQVGWLNPYPSPQTPTEGNKGAAVLQAGRCSAMCTSPMDSACKAARTAHPNLCFGSTKEEGSATR